MNHAHSHDFRFRLPACGGMPLLLVAALLISLAGCSSSSNTNAESDSGQETASTEAGLLSCEGFCGESPNDGGCWCDDLCVKNDDCCDDAPTCGLCPGGIEVSFGDGLTVCGTSSDEPNMSQNMFNPMPSKISTGDCSGLPRPERGDPKVFRYLNIPYGDAYAAIDKNPNSNSKRWRPATAWSPDTDSKKYIDGRKWGKACLQTGKAKVEQSECIPRERPKETEKKKDRDPFGVEDCLTLNVYTPVDPKATASFSQPVVVWIHGGNYMRGSANSCSFDGTLFASKQDVVVVTVNYRLGVLGFLGNFGDADSKMGNFGLRDQKLALEWVRDHIADFGGDPNKVTLWGESAGASSVGVHLANEESKALFTRAMMDSNHYGMRMATPEMANSRAGFLMDTTLFPGLVCVTPRCKNVDTECGKATEEADKIECLRKCDSWHVLNDANRRTKPLEALKKQGLGGAQYWGPMVEESEKTTPSELVIVHRQPIDSGPFTLSHPVLVGTNGSEGSNVKTDLASNKILSPETVYKGSMSYAFGGSSSSPHPSPRREKADQIFSLQSPGKDNYASLAAQLITDYNFGCATEYVMEGRPQSLATTYAYFYNMTHPSFNFLEYSDSTGICEEEACHGNELPYVWGNPCLFEGVVVPEGFNEVEKDFSNQLMHYLGGFIREGTPAWRDRDQPVSWDEFDFDQATGGGRYLRMSGRYDLPVDPLLPDSFFSMMIDGLGSAKSASPLPNQQCVEFWAEEGTSYWQEVGWQAKSEDEKHGSDDSFLYVPAL